MFNQISQSRFNKIFAIAVALWCIFFIYVVCVVDIVGPYMDDWNQMYFLRQISEGKFNLDLLFERFYGAHTIAIPRLLIAIEYFVFHGANIFPKIFALIMITLSFTLFLKNIWILPLTDFEKTFLSLSGLPIIFSSTQIVTFTYPSAGIQHPGAVFFSLLAIDFFVSDIRKKSPITTFRVFLYLALCVIASLFTAVGLFAFCAIFVGLIQEKPARKSILVYALAFAVLMYFFRPGEVIMRISEDADAITKLSWNGLLQQANIRPLNFFPGYVIQLSLYFGAILETISSQSASLLGGILGATFIYIALFLLLKKRKELLFFQLTLYFLLGHALIAMLGRYQSGDLHFDRYATTYYWLVWAGCIIVFQLNKKYGIAFIALILMLLAYSSYPVIKIQLKLKQNTTQADVNMINNSFVHMTYHKVSVPLGIFKFKPEYFHQFQKDRQWGIYRYPFNPDLAKINDDVCEAKKTKEFIVSEKKFVEYQFDGWNLSRNKHIDYFYALASPDNSIVAYGISMARKPSLLPVFLLPRQEVMIYTVIPRQYHMKDLKLIGGNKDSLCIIQLLDK